MNVLITSASAKIQLLTAFQEAVRPLGGQVIVADCDPMCCAAQFADGFEPMLRDDDPSYADRLLEICTRRDIGLMIPTRDGELPLLAALKPQLEAIGVRVPLPDVETLATCQDKLHFHRYCHERGFPVLDLSDPTQEEAFPVFLRHRDVTFTGGGLMVESTLAFQRLGLRHQDYVVQQYVTDREYSCDVLMDFDGNAVQAVVRERQHLVNGESWRSQIVDMPQLAGLAMDLCSSLKLRGHNLVQMFYSESQGPRLIEVNARFGGCSNLGIKGGLASPERMIQLCRGQSEEARKERSVKVGLTSFRYAVDLLVDGA